MANQQQMVKEEFLRRARSFIGHVRRGAGYDGQGRFDITVLKDALKHGVSLEELGITQEYVDSLEKRVTDCGLVCRPSEVDEITQIAKIRISSSV